MVDLNINSEPECVIGKSYSYSTLMGMTKKELIGLLEIAQRNYGVVNERLFNSTNHLKKLGMALDNACELLEEYSTYDDPTPKDEWKEQCLKYE